ncbi:MAG: hypothetical protein QW597_06880 [Thermoplasmataceae archaeon]
MGRSAVESKAIVTFESICRRDGGYNVDGMFAEELTFTENEIYLWNRNGNRLSIIAILPYSLFLVRNETGDLIRGEIRVNKHQASNPRGARASG